MYSKAIFATQMLILQLTTLIEVWTKTKLKASDFAFFTHLLWIIMTNKFQSEINVDNDKWRFYMLYSPSFSKLNYLLFKQEPAHAKSLHWIVSDVKQELLFSRKASALVMQFSFNFMKTLSFMTRKQKCLLKENFTWMSWENSNEIPGCKHDG